MTNKKKTYQQPEMTVVELDHVDIICTSGGYNEGPLNINNGSGYSLGEEDW